MDENNSLINTDDGSASANSDDSNNNTNKDLTNPSADETTNDPGLVLAPEALLAGKYKTPKDLESGYKEQSKYIAELKTKIEEGTTKVEVPEEYKFDFSKDEALKGTELDLEDPVFKSMMPAFKEAGVSQDQASQIVSTYLKQIKDMAPNEAEETKKLGENGEVIVNAISSFWGKLNEKDKDTLSAITDTADGMEFLYRNLKGINIEKKTPDTSGEGTPLKSGQELVDEAFAYKAKHEATIGSDEAQQAYYNKLHQEGLSLKASGK